MNINLIGLIVFLLASVGILLVLLSKSRRINELKNKTAFAVQADELVKIEMGGSDSIASIVQNFNALGEKLSRYKSSSTELSGIKQEKQGLDNKLKTFEDS